MPLFAELQDDIRWATEELESISSPQDDNKTSLLDYANAHRNYGRG